MRILWLGDSADSGFGTVTRETVSRLLDRGHDVKCINHNVRGWPIEGPLASRTYNRDYFGADGILTVMTQGIGNWRPEQVVILADAFAARELVSPSTESWQSGPVWHHVPIEGTDLSPLLAKLWQVVKPVAITKFGADEIRKVTGAWTPFIPHGVDRTIFHEATKDNPIIGIDQAKGTQLMIRSKADAKRHFGLNPNDIVLLRTDRHMPRKNYNQLLRSVAPILEERDDVKLVIHCRTYDQGGNLPDTKAKLSPKAQSQIGFTEGHDTWKGMGPKTLATLYNAADAYVSNCAEGFGLNLLESISCGTPVVGINYSAVPEVVGDAGWLVDDLRLQDNVYDHYWAEPNGTAYTDLLRGILDRDLLAERGALGPAQAEKFPWDDTAAKWDALLSGAVQ